jgi:hypothetical protein
MTSLVVRKEIRGAIGVLKLERVQVICPACGQQVEAVARDGQIKGYCTVARQYVDFPIKTQLERSGGKALSIGPSRLPLIQANIPQLRLGQKYLRCLQGGRIKSGA